MPPFGMPGMPGLPPGAPMTPPPGMPPGMGAGGPANLPGAEIDPLAQMGLSALDRVSRREPHGRLALEKVRKALELAQQLIAAVIPQVNSMDPATAKDLHVIGRQIADARINLDKRDEEGGPPPEALLSSIQGTGLPSGV